MMKNVLLLCLGFPPAPLAYSQRVAKLCKYLPVETHWRPQVICGEVPFEITSGLDDNLLAEIPPTVGYQRIGCFATSRLAAQLHSRRLFRLVNLVRKLMILPDDYADWIPAAVAAARHTFPQGRGIEAILASGPPNSIYLAGVQLSALWEVPLIVDMRDPWSSVWQKNHWFYSWQSQRTARLEAGLYTKASQIIVNTREAATELAHRFPEHLSKIAVVPNGFDPQDIDWQVGPGLREPGEPDGTVHLLNLGGIRNSGLEAKFYHLVRSYLDDHPEDQGKIKIHFVGASWAQIKDLVTSANVQELCQAHGVVPSNAVGRPLAEADIYLLFQLPQHELSIPSKFYSYLAGGSPILALIPPRLADNLSAILGEHASILNYAAPDQESDIFAKLIETVRRTPAVRRDGVFPPSAAPFDRRQIARQVGAVMDTAVSSWRHRS